MRTRRIRMGMGPEMPATDTHALYRNGALLLKQSDHGYKLHKQLPLILFIECGSGPSNGSGGLNSRDGCPARFRNENANGAAIGRIGALFDERLALERKDGIGSGRLRDTKLRGQFLDRHTAAAGFNSLENGQLRRVQA